MIVSKTYLRFA